MQKMQETWVQSLGWKDPLKGGMATHSSILAWEIPWTESLAGYGPWSHKESDMTEQLSAYTHKYIFVCVCVCVCVYIYIYIYFRLVILLSEDYNFGS